MSIEEKLKDIDSHLDLLESKIKSLSLPLLYERAIKDSLTNFRADIEKNTRILLPLDKRKKLKIKPPTEIKNNNTNKDKDKDKIKTFIKCKICGANVLEKNADKHKRKHQEQTLKLKLQKQTPEQKKSLKKIDMLDSWARLSGSFGSGKHR